MTGLAVKKIRTIGLTQAVTQFLGRSVIETADKVEICGLLSGVIKHQKIALAITVLPLPNISTRSESYAVNPTILYRERRKQERVDQSILALYHSHPNGSVQPSLRDLELPLITDLLLLILTRRMSKIHVACYGYSNGRIHPVEVIAPIAEISI